MYNVNIKKFARSLLSFSMRGNVVRIVDVLTQPFRVLHFRLMDFRSKTSWKLEYNACVGKVQAMLNDRFADIVALLALGHSIQVEDGIAVSETIVFKKSDTVNGHIVVGSVVVTSHTQWGAVPFNVKIPIELQNNSSVCDSIERMVQKHKFAGTQYTITYYQSN